jgi:hypothetical protein
MDKPMIPLAVRMARNPTPMIPVVNWPTSRGLKGLPWRIVSMCVTGVAVSVVVRSSGNNAVTKRLQ